MASYNMNPLPELETGTTLDQVNRNLKVVKNWLYQLDEQLRYNLYNMELDNMTGETVDKLTSVNDEVKAALTVLDGKISAAVESADGRFSELVVDINGITTRVGDAEGNISTLKQTATSLTSAVSDAQGNISALQQTVGSIHLGVSNGTDSSTISLYSNGVAISSANVQITGMVKFSDLAGNGTTTINGANIKTGMISSQYVEAQSMIQVGSSYVQCSQNGVSVYPGSGDVSLGNPSGWVNVNGRFYDAGIGLFDGWVTIRSGCTADSFENKSDQRLKKDIETLGDNFSDLIFKLNPVRYRLKSDSQNSLRFGFIAQEVKKALENEGETDSGALVSFSHSPVKEYDDELAMDYTNLIAPLVKAVQTLDKRIRALEGEGNA